MSEAVHLDAVALREPADADVLVAVRGDDEALVGAEEERGQERGVPQDERPPRGVLVRRQRGAAGLRRRWGWGRRERKGVAVPDRDQSHRGSERARRNGGAPEDVPELISDEDRPPVLRERDLRRPLRELPRVDCQTRTSTQNTQ